MDRQTDNQYYVTCVHVCGKAVCWYCYMRSEKHAETCILSVMMCACNVLMQIVFKTRIYHCNINSHVRAPPPTVAPNVGREHIRTGD